MNTAPEATAEPAMLTLAETLDVKAALPLVSSILNLRGQDLTLDASAIRRIGGQCLQVLLAARATWDAEGHGFRIANPSPDFLDGLTLMGCADLADANPVQD